MEDKIPTQKDNIMKTEHTPTPWATHQDLGEQVPEYIYNEKGGWYVAGIKRNESELKPETAARFCANAEFIVLAANAHDDMKAALKAVAKAYERHEPLDGTIWGEAIDLTEAAIAKATE